MTDMATRVKRTYNLAPRTIHLVREMAEHHGVASSQDAVIELAVDELERRIREQREADAWQQAADDPRFQSEATELDAGYGAGDRETWPA